MGTGWRRAFCTTAPRDSTDRDTREIHNHQQQQQQQTSENQTPSHCSPSPSHRSCIKLGFFSGIATSNPTTPRIPAPPPTATSLDLSCRTTTLTAAAAAGEAQQQQEQPLHSANSTLPKLQCKTNGKTMMVSKPTPKPNLGCSNPTSPSAPFSILRNSLRLSSRNGCGVCLQGVKTGHGMAIYTAECSHVFHFPCIAAQVRKRGSLLCPVCNVTWKNIPLLSAHKYLSSSSSPQAEDAEDSPVLEKATITSIPPAGAVKMKAYNDDEPLFSPAAGARFFPILEEADHEQEDREQEDDQLLGEDVEEFPGFFVNSTSSTRKKIDNDYDRKTLRNVEVKFLPEAAVVSAAKTHETFVVALKVKAPAHPAMLLPPSPANRAPIDLVTVLDVSCSMTSAKLQMLKCAMRLVVSSLGSSDRLSIVAFSAAPQRLLPLRRMTPQGQRSAQRIIDRLVCGRGKCVGEALRKASKVLEDRREKNHVASIILLSDGQDEKMKDSGGFNHRRLTHCHDSSIRFAHIEIPVRSFGCEAGEEAFTRCIGGLLSVVVQDLRVHLRFSSSSVPAEIMAVYSSHDRPTLLSCDAARVGDLYAEEERELLIELKVPTSAIVSHHVMSVRCSYRDPASQELMYCKEQALLLPCPHTVRSTDPRIERLWKLFVSTRAVAESRRLVEHGEFISAQHLLSSARAVLMKSGPPAGDEFTKRVEAELEWLSWEHQHKERVVEVQRRGAGEKEVTTAAFVQENREPLTPTSSWRAAERLAKEAIMKKSLNKVSDLHGLENARF